jgi:hypothetical protein
MIYQVPDTLRLMGAIENLWKSYTLHFTPTHSLRGRGRLVDDETSDVPQHLWRDQRQESSSQHGQNNESDTVELKITPLERLD